MAASSSSLASVGFSSSGGSGFYERLNTQWHERALQVFMVVVLAHWSEHLAQAIQIYYLGWPRPTANGILGLWYPWLITSELMHYLYALVMLIGLWVLRKGFTGTGRKWWTIALVIQFWHKPVPVSVLQLFFPRVELHLFYNTIVFIPMVIGMYYHMFPPEGEAHNTNCSCAFHPPAAAGEGAA